MEGSAQCGFIGQPAADGDGLVSAARYVDDVDADPVVLFDGLTKNWRYPGWRQFLVNPSNSTTGSVFTSSTYRAADTMSSASLFHT